MIITFYKNFLSTAWCLYDHYRIFGCIIFWGCFSDKLEQGGVPCDTVPATDHHRRLLDHDPLL